MSQRNQEQGFALLIVLWWTALLAILATNLALSGRLDAHRAGNLREAAVADALADDALQESLFHLLDRSSAGWMPAGSVHVLALPGGQATVRIENESGKLGLNAASPALVSALLQRLGVAPREATALGDAVLDWRTSNQQARPLGAKAADYRHAGLGYAPPESDFETVDELAFVRGMNPQILAKLMPIVSVYQNDEPDPTQASLPLQQALQDVGQRPNVLPDVKYQLVDDHVLTIMVRVVLSSGSQVMHRTVVRLTPNTPPAAYRILEHS